jgi:hypothetical protein
MRLRPIGSRFSLLTLLLLTAIIALSITVAMLYRELLPLREEVTLLRNELGELRVEDVTKLHAIRAETDNELEWKWRIWLPQGARYRLRGSGGSIPEHGYPTSGGAITLREPGEQVIRYTIRRDPRDGQWYGTLQAQGGSVGKDQHRWVEWSSKSSTESGVGTSTRSFRPEEQVELVRFRVSQAKSSEDIENPSDGFMIWLEPN